MQITNQRRMAASILSRREGRIVGVHRIWIHPDYIDQVSSATGSALDFAKNSADNFILIK